MACIYRVIEIIASSQIYKPNIFTIQKKKPSSVKRFIGTVNLSTKYKHMPSKINVLFKSIEIRFLS